MRDTNPNPLMEAAIDSLGEMVTSEYGLRLTILYLVDPDHDFYKHTIAAIEAKPRELQRKYAVWVRLPEAEMLSYPYLDTEVVYRHGATKLRITSNMVDISDVLGLIGSQRLYRD